jgi:iron(III) transport system permease protein
MADAAIAVGVPPSVPGRLVRPVRSTDQQVITAGLFIAGLFFLFSLVLPLLALFVRAFQTADGSFAGLSNFVVYVSTPSLAVSAWNSTWTAAASTVCVVPIAYFYAYGLTRSCMPLKLFFRAVMLVPVLAPSLLPALAMIYLFGNQGFFFSLLQGGTIYGAGGIIASQVFYCFPHAALILTVALSGADARLYEAAAALKAGRMRIFLSVTLPGSIYGLVAASVVVFTLVVTDFGIPKVIGGSFSVLATEIYRQVVGLQNFNMGAVVGIVLLLPAGVAFVLERWAQSKQASVFSGRAVAYVPKPRAARDWPLFAGCLLVTMMLLGVTGMAVWGSFITFWPWNMALTWANFEFGRFDSAGWGSLEISARFALYAAVFGTVIAFLVAYLLERAPKGSKVAPVVRLFATIPLAVPGLVMGLCYIMFFNHPANPFGFLMGTVAILSLNTIAHLYTVCHLTAVTAIRQLDPEFESVSASLKVSVWVTFWRVTLPICIPAIIEIFVYLFVNAMATVSAVIFLWGPDTKPAAVAVVQMQEAGFSSAAAAMALVILAVNVVVKVLQVSAGGTLDRLTQSWRRR